MNVAGYVRVSTREQAQEGYSIPEQSERLQKYCEAKGWSLVKTYIDGGYSGAKLDRPAMQELIKECRKYDMVLVYKLDRLSRNQRDTLYLIEDVFKANNVYFSSMQENFDTSTPVGMAMVGIISVFAQLEREQIKERMAMGKEGKAKQGNWIVSTPPIGYRYVKKTDDADGHLEVREDEAAQVREIFELFLSGMSLRQICFYMDERYSGHSYYNSSFVRRILQNPVYYGMIQWKGELYPGTHNPIISEDTFLQAQRVFSRRKSLNIGKTTHLLTGIVYCGVCGSRMYYVSKGKYGYYKCGQQIRKITQHIQMKKPCNNKSIRSYLADDAVLEEIKKIRIKDISEPKQIDNSKKIEAIDKQIDRTLKLYTIGDIEISKVKRMVESLTEKKKRLQEEEARKTPVDAARRGVTALGDIFPGDDIKAQINAVRAIVERVTIADGVIDIELTFK